ncbi:hypothetical protein D3C76_365980 [compost metagenome]
MISRQSKHRKLADVVAYVFGDTQPLLVVQHQHQDGSGVHVHRLMPSAQVKAVKT